MIVSVQHPYVCVAIPKTGTQSMVRFLLQHHAGSQHAFHHSWRVPDEYTGYEIFTVVRNPYEWCFSKWWFACNNPNRQNSVYPYGMDFRNYIQRITRYREHDPHPDRNVPELNMSRTRWVEKSGAGTVLKLEELTAALSRLHFVTDTSAFPHTNRSPGKNRAGFRDRFGRNEAELVHT